MAEIWQLGAEELARRVRARELEATAVLEAVLARTREVEPRIRAYLTLLEDRARERAAEIDGRLEAGEDPGPLAGVPVALKDNLSLAGAPLTCGSRILAGYVPPFSATAVARLLGAGAVVLGKTNLDEFAMGSSCEHSAFHPTRNPWHLGRVPGGSSGGSAAAVAAGSVPLGFGSDTGGSVRQPAAFCGVVAVKPTYGRVSRYGLVAFASSTDQIGPLARSVRDAALGLGVIAGHDPRDSTSSRRPAGDYLAGLEDGIEGMRVGVVAEAATGDLAPAARRNWQEAVTRLAGLGAEVVEVSIPTLEAAVAIYYVLTASEASANLARFDGVRYGRRAAAAADLEGLYFEGRSQGFGAEVKRRIMLGTFALAAGYYEAYYGRARGVLGTLKSEFAAAFGAADVLITPTSPGGAFALGEKVGDPLTMYLSDVYTVPASLAGLPAVVVPSGRDDDGLPLSLQVMAPPWQEATALRVARAFEADLGWRVEPRLGEAAGA